MTIHNYITASDSYVVLDIWHPSIHRILSIGHRIYPGSGAKHHEKSQEAGEQTCKSSSLTFSWFFLQTHPSRSMKKSIGQESRTTWTRAYINIRSGLNKKELLVVCEIIVFLGQKN